MALATRPKLDAYVQAKQLTDSKSSPDTTQLSASSHAMRRRPLRLFGRMPPNLKMVMSTRPRPDSYVQAE
jgi:hypothetical protein